MSDYRRNLVPGGSYFFTCVTFHRQKILTTNLGRECLHEAIECVRRNHPFTIVATVLLPDHWHTIWSMPSGDEQYPLRWMRVKEEFTKLWLDRGGAELSQSESRKGHRYRGVWQKRYWEHTVRNEQDLERCVDYIHWNPRKHRVAKRVHDWPWSSFHRFVDSGHYDVDWGGSDPVPDWDAPEWGE